MPAITYDGVDGVLTHVGSHVGPWNTARALARVTVPNNLLGIIQTLEASNAANRMDVIQLTTIAARKYQRAILEYMRDLATAVDLRYMDRTTILDVMGLTNPKSVQDVIAAFIDKMEEDVASVLNSTVTVGSPTAD